MLRQALSIGLAACGLSACAWGYDGYYEPGYSYPNGYDYPNGYNYGSGPIYYQGTQWNHPPAPQAPRQPYTGELSGPGVPVLDDWLRETTEGRAIVTLGFHDAFNGVISENVAQRANIWFRHEGDKGDDRDERDEEDDRVKGKQAVIRHPSHPFHPSHPAPPPPVTTGR